MCKEKAQCGFKAHTYFGFHELSDLDRGSLPEEPGAGSAASARCSRTRKAGHSAVGGKKAAVGASRFLTGAADSSPGYQSARRKIMEGAFNGRHGENKKTFTVHITVHAREYLLPDNTLS